MIFEMTSISPPRAADSSFAADSKRGSVQPRVTNPLCVLLSDGSSLTARQVATQAHRSGHTVGVLSPTRLGLAGLTRHVRRLHAVPPFGQDPYGWLEATLKVVRRDRYDVMIATHEQAALLALEAPRLRELGLALAVPSFAAMLRVQDKAAAVATLTELGLPQPHTSVFSDADELLDAVAPPLFLKAPIGTASSTVRLVRDKEGLRHAVSEFVSEGALGDGGLIAQEPVEGPVAMIQTIFDRGTLVAWHANLRTRPGPNGGSSAKLSIRPAVVQRDLQTLGGALQWHGALSLDAVLTETGPRYIDVNPRLVEPGNAWHAGIDLVAALIAVSLGLTVEPCEAAHENVRTHQVLLAVLAAAEQGRRAVARELLDAWAARGPYTASIEELTPRDGDPLASLPVVAAAAATLLAPSARRWFTDAAIASYAMTSAAWREIKARPQDEPARPGATAHGGGAA
jgi:hypothetical protein